MELTSTEYWHKYNQLRRSAKEWGIEHTRYTHVQLKYVIELNAGKIDPRLKMYLAILPPVNAYFIAKMPLLAEAHTESFKPAMEMPSVQERTAPQAPTPAPERSQPTISRPIFALPAPKEASPWARIPAL
jgi:hypothetical protein